VRYSPKSTAPACAKVGKLALIKQQHYEFFLKNRACFALRS